MWRRFESSLLGTVRQADWRNRTADTEGDNQSAMILRSATEAADSRFSLVLGSDQGCAQRMEEKGRSRALRIMSVK